MKHFRQRLAGASLLIFANKQDIPSSLSKQQIAEVCSIFMLLKHVYLLTSPTLTHSDSAIRLHYYASLAY
jgi:signal recognition particle receptor subunit beta